MTETEDVCTLYYFPFSLYSLMARFGFEIAKTLNPETAPDYALKLVNLHEDQEVSEWYLTKISSKGQVSSQWPEPCIAWNQASC